MTRFSNKLLGNFFYQPKKKDSYYKRIIVVEKTKTFLPFLVLLLSLSWAKEKNEEILLHS